MAMDSFGDRAGGRDALDPSGIANHPLLTAREKMELLHRLRAEVSGALGRDRDPGISPADIDAAIEEVKRRAQRGAPAETVLRGDN